MPVPKKKTPKSKQRRRRSHIQKPVAALTTCPQCHSPRLPHHVCPTCGHYHDRQAIPISEPELPSE